MRQAEAHSPEDFESLVQLVTSAERLVVLTGAGCSTESGIPDYRDDEGQWKRSRPVLFEDFIAREPVRRRYWARSFVGWGPFSQAAPGAAHFALARLEALGLVKSLITQNVDGLHQRAGSSNVIELHGTLTPVSCLGCGQRHSRRSVQQRLDILNPAWRTICVDAAPDGDAQLDAADWEDFQVPDCERCGGLLKPDVVFFGERVPRDRVTHSMAELESADGLLVVGSSLMVFSGFRFAREAERRGIIIGAINRGRTRADPFLRFKVRTSCSDALARLLAKVS